MFHISDNIVFLGKLLSCFVTERKHRVTKRAALFTFRGIENHVITQMLNRHCENLLAKPNLFRMCYMVNPRRIRFGNGVCAQRANAATLPCGRIHASDVVWFLDNAVGKVVCFWASDVGTNVVVQFRLYEREGDSAVLWRTTDSPMAMSAARDIVDAVMWAPLRDGVIRVLRPVRSLV